MLSWAQGYQQRAGIPAESWEGMGSWQLTGCSPAVPRGCLWSHVVSSPLVTGDLALVSVMTVNTLQCVDYCVPPGTLMASKVW